MSVEFSSLFHVVAADGRKNTGHLKKVAINAVLTTHYSTELMYHGFDGSGADTRVLVLKIVADQTLYIPYG